MDRKERLCRPCDPWSLSGPAAATELSREKKMKEILNILAG